MALRAWDLRAARGQLDLPHALLWLGIGAVVGGLPLLVMLPTVGIVALLAGMLVTPVVGLYALLIAIPFSPSLGVEDAGFSISVFEPLAAILLVIWLARGVTRREIELPLSGLFGALFFLICALLVAATGATDLALALKETLKWVLLALAFAFAYVQLRDEPRTRQALAVLFFAGSGQAIMGLVQFVA